MSRMSLRAGGIAVVTAMAVAVLSNAAFAHVTVNPSTASRGGYTKLTFRVPTEKDDASTTKVQVFFPADVPFAYVGVRPHAGWTYSIARHKLATPIKSDDGDVTEGVSAITWTANDKVGIKPSEFDEFDVSVGPLPNVPSVTFKALQTYSNGDVVRWIEVKSADGKDPEHPAPVLTLTAKPAVPASASPAADTANATISDAPQPTRAQSSTLAIVLAALALLVALGALTLAGRSRRR